MQRRRLMAAVAGAAGLAGCATASIRDPSPTPDAGERAPLARRGEPGDVCRQDAVDVGIPAVVEPAYGDAWFGDDRVVVGIERGGHARAYPLSVLSSHEVVNDAFPGTDGSDGRPLLVTYCPSCNSGMVAERRVDGEPTAFGVSGQVWAPPDELTRASEEADRAFAVDRDDPGDDVRIANNGALVLYDAATGSYWSQVLARAICGPARGTTLRVVPSTTARWGEWRREHPDTEVLQPYPESAVGNPPLPGGGRPDGPTPDRNPT